MNKIKLSAIATATLTCITVIALLTYYGLTSKQEPSDTSASAPTAASSSQTVETTETSTADDAGSLRQAPTDDGIHFRRAQFDDSDFVPGKITTGIIVEKAYTPYNPDGAPIKDKGAIKYDKNAGEANKIVFRQASYGFLYPQYVHGRFLFTSEDGPFEFTPAAHTYNKTVVAAMTTALNTYTMAQYWDDQYSIDYLKLNARGKPTDEFVNKGAQSNGPTRAPQPPFKYFRLVSKDDATNTVVIDFPSEAHPGKADPEHPKDTEYQIIRNTLQYDDQTRNWYLLTDKEKQAPQVPNEFGISLIASDPNQLESAWFPISLAAGTFDDPPTPQ